MNMQLRKMFPEPFRLKNNQKKPDFKDKLARLALNPT